jgi:hypothetical protein
MSAAGEDAGLIAVTAIGGATAATVVWRRRAQLYLTTVVKGTFHLVPEGLMTPFGPEPIAVGEQDDGSGMGLYSAGDLAPYLRYTDVVLTGHAHAGPGATVLDARLEVIRGGIPLLDKTVRLDVLGGTAVRVVGMGPLSRSWPVRRRLLGDLDPAALEGSIAEIPTTFDWSYFQTAPLDQRIGGLRGDEWIALRGMHQDHAWFRTRLPGVRGVALISCSAPGVRQAAPIALSIDTLHLDVDLQRCTLLFRGWIPIADERMLPSLHVVAGMELPGQPTVWSNPLSSEPAHDSPWAHGLDHAEPASERAGSQPPRRSSLPPAPPSSPMHATPADAYAKTMALDAVSLAPPAAEASGAPAEPPSAPDAPAPDPEFVATHPEVFTKTVNLSLEDLERLA